MINIKNEFWNANEAFEYFYKTISKHGTKFADTRAMFNVGFTIMKPEVRIIIDDKRKWNKDMLKLNGNGIYLVTEVYLNQENYMEQYP